MPLGGWLSDRLCEHGEISAGRGLVAVAGMVGGAGFLLLGVLAREPAWIVFWFARWPSAPWVHLRGGGLDGGHRDRR